MTGLPQRRTTILAASPRRIDVNVLMEAAAVVGGVAMVRLRPIGAKRREEGATCGGFIKFSELFKQISVRRVLLVVVWINGTLLGFLHIYFSACLIGRFEGVLPYPSDLCELEALFCKFPRSVLTFKRQI
jgi:hypothetical protein